MEKYNISRSGSLPEIWPNTAPTTKSATPKSPMTKSKTPKSPNGARAVESDSPTSQNVAPATKKMSSFPFLTVTLLLLSWLACSVSQLQHSFPELILELAFDELCLSCTLLLPNYSSTELVLYWAPLFCFLNLRNSEVSPPRFLWQQPANSRLRDQKK